MRLKQLSNQYVYVSNFVGIDNFYEAKEDTLAKIRNMIFLFFPQINLSVTSRILYFPHTYYILAI